MYYVRPPSWRGDGILDDVPFSISVNDGYHYTNIANLSRRSVLQLVSIDTLFAFVSFEFMLRVDMLGLDGSEIYHCTGKYWRVPAEILNGGNSAQCLLPKQDKRTQLLRLTGGHQSVMLGEIVFSGKPEVASLNPLHGFKSETYVELAGTNFDHVRFCVFTILNEVVVKYFVETLHISPGTIACRSPPSTPGDIFSVDVSADGYNAINTGMIFEHQNAPEIQSFEPSFVPHGQGSKIIIKGRNFVDSRGLSCSFDSKVVHAHFVSSQELFCISPALQPGSTKIAISSNSAHFVCIFQLESRKLSRNMATLMAVSK